MNESSDDPPPIARTRIWELSKSYVSNLPIKGRPHHTRRDLEQTVLPLRSPSSPRIHTHGHPPCDPSTSPELNSQHPEQNDSKEVSNAALQAPSTGGTATLPAEPSLEQDDPKKWYIKSYQTGRMIISSSWINWLLLCVPPGIALGAVNRSLGASSPVSPTVVFAINAVAIIPLASLLGYATECVAADLGDTIGALLNVTFGNAVELIILYVFNPYPAKTYQAIAH